MVRGHADHYTFPPSQKDSSTNRRASHLRHKMTPTQIQTNSNTHALQLHHTVHHLARRVGARRGQLQLLASLQESLMIIVDERLKALLDEVVCWFPGCFTRIVAFPFNQILDLDLLLLPVTPSSPARRSGSIEATSRGVLSRTNSSSQRRRRFYFLPVIR